MAIDINIPSQVKSYANLAGFPATGSLKTIFIAEDTNKTYRWTGSAYVEISASQATAWGAITGTLSAQTDLQTALNAKQDSLGFTAVPTTRTLTINGTTQDLSADRTFTISTGITIGTTAITSGTVGRVLFEGTGNVVQESSSLTYDDTLKVFSITGPIGSVFQHTSLTNYNGLGGFQLNVADGTERGLFKLNPTSGEVRIGATGSGYFPTFYAQGVEAMRIFASTRNVAINTTTDAGFRLDVNGTARVVNQATIQTLTIGLGGGAVATNTALGLNALTSNTTGANNTSVGSGSLRANTIGDYNTSIGLDALRFNTSGGQNTAIGWRALNSVLTGYGNVAVGSQALISTTGGFNIGIGERAGQNNTTGVNNIFIGAQSTGASATESNRTWIGNSTTTSTWLAGNVLINTTTDAGFRLDVNGTARLNGNLTFQATSWILDNSNAIMHRGGFNVESIAFNLSRMVFTDNNGFVFNGNNSGATLTASSIVDIQSTTKGFLPPRMTTTQKNAIASPATGLMVYDTTLNVISYYNGTMWI